VIGICEGSGAFGLLADTTRGIPRGGRLDDGIAGGSEARGLACRLVLQPGEGIVSAVGGIPELSAGFHGTLGLCEPRSGGLGREPELARLALETRDPLRRGA